MLRPYSGGGATQQCPAVQGERNGSAGQRWLALIVVEAPGGHPDCPAVNGGIAEQLGAPQLQAEMPVGAAGAGCCRPVQKNGRWCAVDVA